MFKKVSNGPAIVVCNTCRHSANERIAPNGNRGGENLLESLKAVQAKNPRYKNIDIQEMGCLFACSDFCTIHIRAEGKIGYVIGRLQATETDAVAILDYASFYAESEHGQVSYTLWPEDIKGHFITRTPPSGHVVE